MDKIEFIKTNYGKLTQLEIAKELDISINSVRYIVYKNISKENRYRRGKSPHCKPKRKFNLNDYSFSEYNNESCYWAGLMAADGNITTHWDSFSIALKESDKEHIEQFKEWLNFEGPVGKATVHYTYKGIKCEKFSYYIKPTSPQIVEDLNKNFGIFRNKSLSIMPPIKIPSLEGVDSFIKGYIDGDGSVMLDSSKGNTSRLSIVGTYDMINWINNRFENILNRVLPPPSRQKNVWRIDFRNKISRSLLQHYFNVSTPELKRKWTPELKNIVFNYKKSRNIENYKNIYSMMQTGKTKTEVANILNVSPSAISWITKQDCYIGLIKESAARDNNEADMEEDS